MSVVPISLKFAFPHYADSLHMEKGKFNSLAPGKCVNGFKNVILDELIKQNISLGTHCEIALRWMSKNFTDEKST